MAKNQFIDKNILIISEDEKSFIFYIEYFLKELKFQNNNNKDLIKYFGERKLKTKKQRYFIKFKNFERIKIALICPKNQSSQDIVDLAKTLKNEERRNKKIKFDNLVDNYHTFYKNPNYYNPSISGNRKDALKILNNLIKFKDYNTKRDLLDYNTTHLQLFSILDQPKWLPCV